MICGFICVIRIIIRSSFGQAKIAAQKESVIAQETEERVKKFAANQDGVSVLTKRKISEVEASSTHLDHRKKVLDETDKQVANI